MPKSKTIDQLLNDAVARRSTPPARRQSVHMYAQCLVRRGREIEFAFEEIQATYGRGETVSTSVLSSPEDEMRFRCVVFWAMTYSLFDIFANAANSVLGIYADESRPSFKSIRSPDWDASPSLVALAAKVKTLTYFVRIDNLRNCSLHRRVVMMEKLVIHGDPAYAQFDSTGPCKPRIEWRLSKNPHALTMDANSVELLRDCEKLKDRTIAEIIGLVRAI